MSAYPLHGAVSLSNIPGPTAAAASKTASNSLVPDYGIKNENIPNLSFSLKPSSEAGKEDTDDEEIVKDEGKVFIYDFHLKNFFSISSKEVLIS